MCREFKPSEGVEQFTEFAHTITHAGAIDEKSKELIILALSLATQCEKCTEVHVKKAAEMGISSEEMEEAASLALMFGGIKSFWLWKEAKEAAS